MKATIGVVLDFILNCIALFALRIVKFIYVFISLRPITFKVGDCWGFFQNVLGLALHWYDL